MWGTFLFESHLSTRQRFSRLIAQSSGFWILQQAKPLLRVWGFATDLSLKGFGAATSIRFQVLGVWQQTPSFGEAANMFLRVVDFSTNISLQVCALS